MMIYTSGTTGQPKGALHAHRVLLGHLPGVEMPHDFLPQPGDRFWTPADWAWAGGLLDVLAAEPALRRAGGRRDRFEKFDPEEAFALMARTACATPSSRRPRCGCCARCATSARPLRPSTCARSAPAASARCRDSEWGRDARAHHQRVLRPDRMQPGALRPARVIGRVASRARSASRCPATIVAVIRSDGARADAGELGQIAVKRPDPVMFLGVLGAAGGDAREIRRRLDDHRRSGRRG